MILPTVEEDVLYLDKAYKRLVTFTRLYNDIDNSII